MKLFYIILHYFTLFYIHYFTFAQIAYRLHRRHRLLYDARLQPKVVKTQYDQCEPSVV